MQFLGNQAESQQADTLLTSQREVEFFGIANSMQDTLHFLWRHSRTVILNRDIMH